MTPAERVYSRSVEDERGCLVQWWGDHYWQHGGPKEAAR